jgi:lipopolysaccharide biosynthesis glycosyltransferase
MRVGTICARNYLSSAILLGESLGRVHPDWEFNILLVDIWREEKERYEQDFPQFTWFAPEDLAIDEEQLGRMKFYYDVIEFSTSLKPWLLEKLLADGDVAMYLDPDIEVFNSLEDLVASAVEDEIVLLPHVTKPVPRDDRDPKEETFLLSGQFNLGFLCVSRSAGQFLEYWKERLTQLSVIDHEHGYFTDQRWVDAVPSLFRHKIVRTPGYNLAYWNLHEVELSSQGSLDNEAEVQVDGQPLRFFHFSGHDPNDPMVLSKYAPNPRVDVTSSPILRSILERRGARMSAQHQVVVPYRWNRLPDGRAIARTARRGFRHLVNLQPRIPAPFVVGGEDQFANWLDDDGPEGVSNLSTTFWMGIADREPGAPFPQGPERQEFFAALCDDQGFLKMASTSALQGAFRESKRTVAVRPGFNLTPAQPGETELESDLRRRVLGAGIPLWQPSHEGQQFPIPLERPFAITLTVARGTDRNVPAPQTTDRRVEVVVVDEVPEAHLDEFGASLRPFDEIWCLHEASALALRRFVNNRIKVVPWGSSRYQPLSPSRDADKVLGVDRDSSWLSHRFEELLANFGWRK